MKQIMPANVRIVLARLRSQMMGIAAAISDLEAQYCQCPDNPCRECDCGKCPR